MTVLAALVGMCLAMVSVPVVVFAAEVLVTWPMRMPWMPGRRSAAARPARHDRPPLTVLMPAHDEALVIGETLRKLRSHLKPGDTVLVVADNCTDDTASIARANGAEVVERFNTQLRGKGYALDHGVRHMAAQVQPPRLVVIFDADCTMLPGSLDVLAAKVERTGRPAQAVYLMENSRGNQAVSPVAEFAWRVRNLLRPAGLQALGGPCHLTGSGMAFPWDVLVRLPLASGHIAEDMKMGVELARMGTPPVLALDALVTSTFPVSLSGAQSQRTRWEHGTLGMLVAEVPAMLSQALQGQGKGLLYLALDMMVPPLALLAMLTMGGVMLATLWALVFSVSGLVVWVWCLGLLLVLAVALAWFKVGRDLLAPSQVFAVLAYALGKGPVYVRFVFKRQMDWVRSKRDAD